MYLLRLCRSPHRIRGLVALCLAIAALFMMTSHSQAAIPDDELLVNGDFELYHVGWTETGTVIIRPTGSLPRPPYSGVYAAWLGGYNDADDEMFQNVDVPANINFAKLHLWYWSFTPETTYAVDYFTLQLVNPVNGSHYVDAITLDAVPPTNQYQPHTYILNSADLDAIRGKTVRVLFRVYTDARLTSSFVVDDVSFDFGSDLSRHLYLPTTPRTAH